VATVAHSELAVLRCRLRRTMAMPEVASRAGSLCWSAIRHEPYVHRLPLPGTGSRRPCSPTTPPCSPRLLVVGVCHRDRAGRSEDQLPPLCPYNPQTCREGGTVPPDREKWLSRQRPTAALAELKGKLDWFREYYNARRPDRALRLRTPQDAFAPDPRHRPRGARGPKPLPSSAGQDRLERAPHTSVQQPASPHRVGREACRHPGRRPRR
jgi:hypothetical protein